ncbi:MAG: cation diffusion facilitator family transporter [Planctomycetaceae bacterium]|nr:cation diffusion facilitator family transporter [Planctomycetaceae bacterium]
MEPRTEANQRAAMWGVVVNLVMVAAKLAGGILGHSYALVADAIESTVDVFASLVVWAGVRVTARPPDEQHPYGYGRAEPLTVAVVALMLLGAAFGIAVSAIHEIVTPHHAPAPFTLAVLAGVVLVKEVLFRRVLRVAESTTSTAVEADAWHHRSDAITSAAAFLGILIALWGGPGWEAADDWAAVLAAVIIAANGVRFLRTAVSELMDREPDPQARQLIAATAVGVEGVLAIEKLRVRKVAESLLVDLHVQAAPAISLHDAHSLSGRVKATIRQAVPSVREVLIHMEPFEPASKHE